MIADRLHQLEGGILGEIVEEDAADAARLAAVSQVEVLVAPALEPGIALGAEWRQGIPAGSMKVLRVLLEAVVRALDPCRRRTTKWDSCLLLKKI